MECDEEEVEVTWTGAETVDPFVSDVTVTDAAANEVRRNTAGPIG
jgi:hypothetical protein